MREIIKSEDPEVGTFVCPKCKAIWRARGQFEHLVGAWHYDDDDCCPHGCMHFIFFRVRGDEVI